MIFTDNDGLSRHPFPPTKEIGVAERNSLYDSLIRLGSFYELDFNFDSRQVFYELKQFSSNWVQYNPYKSQNPRFGLSVTSLDGELGGKPDLYSLREYYRREGTLYRESDFRIFTEVYEKIPAIHELLSYFHPYIGRTHFLRFNAGGHFPPHRDGAGMEAPDTFRLLAPIALRGDQSHAFMLGNRKLHFREDSVFFLHTLLPHSIFSFLDNVIYLVCNVVLNAETVAKLKAKLQEK
jgi:hypothetical protein